MCGKCVMYCGIYGVSTCAVSVLYCGNYGVSACAVSVSCTAEIIGYLPVPHLLLKSSDGRSQNMAPPRSLSKTY